MVTIDEYSKALESLGKALSAPQSDLNRDATIQRFEFCVELAWKTARKVLLSKETSPKMVIREMYAQQLITDPNLWFSFIEARNLSSHTYNEVLAEKVYGIAASFLPHGMSLLEKLKQL